MPANHYIGFSNKISLATNALCQYQHWRVHTQDFSNTAPSWGGFTPRGTMQISAERKDRDSAPRCSAFPEGTPVFPSPLLTASPVRVSNFRGSVTHIAGSIGG